MPEGKAIRFVWSSVWVNHISTNLTNTRIIRWLQEQSRSRCHFAVTFLKARLYKECPTQVQALVTTYFLCRHSEGDGSGGCPRQSTVRLSSNWSELVISIAWSLETISYSPSLLDTTVPAWVVLKIFFLHQPQLPRINKNVFELSRCYFPFSLKFHLDVQNWSRGDWKCVNLTAESSRLLLYCPKSSRVRKQ